MYNMEPAQALLSDYTHNFPTMQASASNDHHDYIPMIASSSAFFAKERLKLHQAAPDEGVSIEVLKKYIFKKYGI